MDNNNNQKQEKLKISVDSHLEFIPVIEARYTDSTMFCEEIVNPLMNNTFKDYYGSRIEIEQNRMIGLYIFFMETASAEDDQRFACLERVVSQEAMKDMDNRIKYYNSTLNNSGYKGQYKLSKEGCELLEGLISNQFKRDGKVQWKSVTTEINVNNAMTMAQAQTCMRIKIDIHKLVKLVYGTKDGKNEYQYMVTTGNPINPVSTYDGTIIAKQWQLFIQRLTSAEADKIARMYGYSGLNTMGIITN